MALILALLTLSMSSTTAAPDRCDTRQSPEGSIPSCTDCLLDTRGTLYGDARNLGGDPRQPARVVIAVAYDSVTKSYEFPARLDDAKKFSVALGAGIDGTILDAKIRRGKPGAVAELPLWLCRPPMAAPSAEEQ